MILHGTPIEFSQTEILTTAVFLQIRVSEILNASKKIFQISIAERNLVMMHNSIDYDGVYCFNDLIYTSIPHDKLRLLIIAYLLLENDRTSLESLLEIFHSFNETINAINSHQRDYTDVLNRRYIELSSYTGYKKWDMDIFAKAARRYKAIAEMVDNEIAITFKNVKCGNETEGYIQYKSIQLFLNSQGKKLDRLIFTFNKFFWDTNWGNFIGCLHPHINGTSLCLGNRKNDYKMYILSHSYPFMIEVLKESVNNYSPDGPPYSAVNVIRQRLSVLNNLIDVKLQTDGKKSLNEVNDPRQWLNSIRQDNKCPHCNSLISGNVCSGGTCHSNPEYIHNCGNRGQPTTVGAWDETRRTYPRTCTNINCGESPNYVGIVDIPYCRVCGSLELNENHSCVNTRCRGSRYIQWRLFNNRFRAVSINGVGIPTPEEAAAMRERNVDVMNAEPAQTSVNSEYFCPNCFEPLTRSGNSYSCSNNNCNGRNYSYFTSTGVWFNSARYPVCPECGDDLEYRAGEGFFCENDECENYDSRLIHANGAPATPF